MTQVFARSSMYNLMHEGLLQQISDPDDRNYEPLIDFENQSILRLPYFGRVHFVKEKMGLLCSSLILFYWIYGNWYTYNFIIIPHIIDGFLQPHAIILYGVISILTIVAFFRASFADPGKVYKDTHEMNSYGDDWTWCKICCIRRPNRSHHCKKCGHCTLKMDHHCPWINNCVGEGNHYLFMQLVFYAFVLSFMTLVLCILHMYVLPRCRSCDIQSVAVVYNRMCTYIAVGMSICMTCSSFGLFFTNHLSLHFDFTTLEWIILLGEIKKKQLGLPRIL